MNFIICPNCKKNISEKTEKCIHCGAPIQQNKTPTSPSTENNITNYTTLTIPQQEKLQAEFNYKNKTAEAIWRFEVEMNSYKTLSDIGGLAFVLIALFITIAIRYVPLDQVHNEKLMGIAVALWLILLVFFIALKIIFTVMKKKYNKSLKFYYYLKLYQRWLLEEKKIQLIPPFRSLKEKEIFDNIDIHDIQ